MSASFTLPTAFYIPKIAFKDGTVEFVTKLLSTIGSVDRVDLETRYDAENQPFSMGFVYFSAFQENEYVAKLKKDFEKNGKYNFKHPDMKNTRYWMLLENKTPRTLEQLQEEKEDEQRIEEYMDKLFTQEIICDKEIQMHHDLQFDMLNEVFIRFVKLYSKIHPNFVGTYMEAFAYWLQGNGVQSVMMKNSVISLLFQHIRWLYSVMAWKRNNTMDYIYQSALCGKEVFSINYHNLGGDSSLVRTQNECNSLKDLHSEEEYNLHFEKLEKYRISTVPLPTHFLIPRIHNSVKQSQLYDHIKRGLFSIPPAENHGIYLFEKTTLNESFYSIQFSVDWYFLDQTVGLNYELLRNLFKTHYFELGGVCKKDTKKFWKIVAYYDEVEVETYNYLNYVVEHDMEELEDLNQLFFENIYTLQDQLDFLESRDISFRNEIDTYAKEVNASLNDDIDLVLDLSALSIDTTKTEENPPTCETKTTGKRRRILEEGEILEDDQDTTNKPKEDDQDNTTVVKPKEDDQTNKPKEDDQDTTVVKPKEDDQANKPKEDDQDTTVVKPKEDDVKNKKHNFEEKIKKD